jgi:hypothetical protein
MIIILSVIILVMFPLLIGAILRLNRLQHQIELLDREQHTQNMDMINMLKTNNEQDKAILYIIQHIVDKEKITIPSYMGPMGEA